MKKLSPGTVTLLSNVAAIIALLLTLLAFSIYRFESPIIYRLCGDFLYSDLYSICTNSNGNLFYLFKVSLLAVAALFALFVLLSARRNRKRLVTFLKFFVPGSLIILLLSYFVEFCFMYSCSNILPLGILSVILIGVLGLLILLLGSLFSEQKSISAVLLLFLILSTFLIVYYSNLLQLQDKTLKNKLDRPSSTEDCYSARFLSEQDKCLFFIGVRNSSSETCSSIQNGDRQADCVAYITRNRAVADMNILACDQIQVPAQKEVCTSLIEDRIKLKRD